MYLSKTINFFGAARSCKNRAAGKKLEKKINKEKKKREKKKKKKREIAPSGKKAGTDRFYFRIKGNLFFYIAEHPELS